MKGEEESVCFFFQQTDSLFVGPGCEDQIASKDVSSRVAADIRKTHTQKKKNHTSTFLLSIFPIVLSGFPGLLIFTQDIYPVVNGKVPITDKYTFYVFARLFSCLSPYSFLSFTLSRRLGSLNSSVIHHSTAHFPGQTNNISTITAVSEGLKPNNPHAPVPQASLVSVCSSRVGSLELFLKTAFCL